MRFLGILFWCLLAFLAAVFTVGNWQSVPVRLWGGLVAETNLPLLLVIAFLVGLLPTLIYQHMIRWRLRGRLAAAERQLAELRALPVPIAPPRPAAAVTTLPDPVAPPATILPVAADIESATLGERPA